MSKNVKKRLDIYNGSWYCEVNRISQKEIDVEKTFTIVGVSTIGTPTNNQTKFRVANGDLAARRKVLERVGHFDINLIDLPTPMTKLAAIEYYKSLYPEAAGIRMPNQKEVSPKAKTVVLRGANKKSVADAASELLRAIEEV